MSHLLPGGGRMFFFSSRRRHTRWPRDWSSDVCSSDLSWALDPGSEVIYFVNAADQRVWQIIPGRAPHPLTPDTSGLVRRSEERRVGKEGRARRSREPEREKTMTRITTTTGHPQNIAAI